MARIGFSTSDIECDLRDNQNLASHVCMAILEPEGLGESLAVLVFFKSMQRGELMMADTTGVRNKKVPSDS